MGGRQADIHTVDTGNERKNTHQDSDTGHKFENFVEVIGRDSTIGFANISQRGQTRLRKLSELLVAKREIFDEIFIFFVQAHKPPIHKRVKYGSHWLKYQQEVVEIFFDIDEGDKIFIGDLEIAEQG